MPSSFPINSLLVDPSEMRGWVDNDGEGEMIPGPKR